MTGPEREDGDLDVAALFPLDDRPGPARRLSDVDAALLIRGALAGAPAAERSGPRVSKSMLAAGAAAIALFASAAGAAIYSAVSVKLDRRASIELQDGDTPSAGAHDEDPDLAGADAHVTGRSAEVDPDGTRTLDEATRRPGARRHDRASRTLDDDGASREHDDRARRNEGASRELDDDGASRTLDDGARRNEGSSRELDDDGASREHDDRARRNEGSSRELDDDGASRTLDDGARRNEGASRTLDDEDASRVLDDDRGPTRSSRVLDDRGAARSRAPHLDPGPPRGPRVSGEDLLERANALRGARRWREAERAYQRVAREAPRTPAAYVALIAAASLRVEHLADPKTALELYARARTAHPNGALDADILFGIAAAHQARHDRAAERRALEDLLDAHPTSVFAASAKRRLADLERGLR